MADEYDHYRGQSGSARPPNEAEGANPSTDVATVLDVENFGRLSGPNAELVSMILSRLERMKAEVFKEIQRSTLEVKNLVSSTCGTRPGTPTSRSTARGRAPSANETDSETRKRALPDPDDVTDVLLMATREYAWLPVMRLIMMYTVLSFSANFRATRDWITGRKRENFCHVEALCVPGVSGLSLIYFSVASDDLKSRHDCALGKAWSALCTDVIVSIMMSARRDFFGARGTARVGSPGPGEERPIPDWLASFRGKREATVFVQRVVEQLERTNQLPLQRERSKRARRAAAASPQTRTIENPLRPFREVAVRTIRTAVLRAMTDGRTAARLHLYKSFLFVVEEVAKYSTPAYGCAAGVEVILGDPASDEERDVPSVLDGTIWDIGLASKDARGYEVNKDALDKLGERFPSLTVTLKYRKKVLGVPASVRAGEESMVDNDDVDNGNAVGIEGDLYFDVEEVVSLHTVAVGLLVDTYKMQTHKVVLGASELSLRTIHIMAIGFRGLILKVLDKELSRLEATALGAIEHRYLTKEDVIATVIVGNRNDTDAVRKGLEKERAFKFSMSYSDYCAKKRRQENERVDADRREASTRSSTGTSADNQHREAAIEDYYDVSWMA